MHYIRLNRELLPVEEHEAAAFIEQNLLALSMNADSFQASVDLYLYAHGRKVSPVNPYDSRRMISWIRIAGRSGAIDACAFLMVMNAINEMHCPVIKSKWHIDQKKIATKLMASEFPHITAIRNSTAHPGELTSSPAERARHSLKNKEVFSGLSFFNEGTFISDAMHGLDDKLMFSASFNGKKLEYELSMMKSASLHRVAEHYRKAFMF